MQPKIIYSSNYDIRLWGFEAVHSFDSRKYSRAWKRLSNMLGVNELSDFLIEPKDLATREILCTVHTQDYIDLLKSPKYVTRALEIPLVGLFLPMRILDKHVLEPMRLAVTGTILASKEALKNGIAINLSGGYHHASKNQGSGFCIYSDIAIAIAILRRTQKISEDDHIMIIDLDAHQGNGLERIFYEDKSVHILDMYNQDIYPSDDWAKKRIDYDIPLHNGTKDEEYLKKLKEYLPTFLNSVPNPKIVFYNAGTDIYEKDPLGKLKISEKGVWERDVFVFNTLMEKHIPFVMLPSGGYSERSYILMAKSIKYLLEKYNDLALEMVER